MNPSQALEMLKDIPEEQYLTFGYTDGVNRCCFVGHLVRLTSPDPTDYSEGNCWPAYRHFSKDAYEAALPHVKEVVDFIEQFSKNGNFEEVNNKYHPNYKQDTIKERVEAFLTDLINKQ